MSYRRGKEKEKREMNVKKLVAEKINSNRA